MYVGKLMKVGRKRQIGEPLWGSLEKRSVDWVLCVVRALLFRKGRFLLFFFGTEFCRAVLENEKVAIPPWKKNINTAFSIRRSAGPGGTYKYL